jgi:LacI family transcriptional regulator
MPKPSTKPSLKDVALSAGVSAPTVSRILNNRRDGFSVRPEVRDRVVNVARELSYRPHLLAQSLRKKTMRIVGVLGIHVPIILPDDVIRGLVEVFEASGIKLSTYFSPTIEASHDLPPWRIDGAIVAGVLKPGDLKALEKARLSYVSINGWAGPHGGSVCYDDADGTRQALSHLVELGHRRIAYLNAHGPWRTHPSVQARHDAYCSFMNDAGLELVPGHDQAWPEDDRHALLRQWIEHDGVTAVLAYQHYQALELMHAAYELGYTPPHRLSVVCFNDEYIGRMMYPQLTAVRLPTYEAGRKAASMLMQHMGKELPTMQPVVLKPELIVRGSTAPPATR